MITALPFLVYMGKLIIHGAGGPKVIMRIESAELAQEWALWIESLKVGWSWYCHLTFRGDPHPESADKVFMKWCHVLNREIFGVRYWNRKETDGVVWLRGSENQDRQVIHYHVLIGRVPDTVRRFQYMDLWNELAGFARIYPYYRYSGAEFYICKYLAKGTQIDIGGPVGTLKQPVFEGIR